MAAFLVIQSVVATHTNQRLRALVELAIDKNYNAVFGINSAPPLWRGCDWVSSGPCGNPQIDYTASY